MTDRKYILVAFPYPSGSVFGWSNENDSLKLLKEITHFIWNTVEEQIDDIADKDTLIDNKN